MISFILLILGAVLVVIAAVFLLALTIGRDAADNLKGYKPPETGIVILEGLPGSGKSYTATKWSIDTIKNDRRIVYSNLPLKIRVIRALLRKTGGEHLTRYVVELTKEHFYRSVARFADLTAYIESNKRTMSKRQAESEWFTTHGPHVPYPMNQAEWVDYRALDHVDADLARSEWVALAGSDECGIGDDGRLLANWMEFGSAIVIDEMHKWADQRKQKEEDPRLLDFLTMHRHGLYFVLLLTQNAMQISIGFRRNCVKFWRCLDMRNMAVIGPIKLPLPLFRYEEIAAAALGDASERTNVKPERTWTEIPFLNGGLYWRLYSSFTHAGSLRQLRQTIERSRQVAEGSKYDPSRTRRKAQMISNRQRWALRLGWMVIAAGACFVSYTAAKSEGAGQAAAPTVHASVQPTPAGGNRASGSPPANASTPRLELPRLPAGGSEHAVPAPPLLAAVGPGFGVVGQTVVRPGQGIQDAIVQSVDLERGCVVLAARGVSVDWFVGSEFPGLQLGLAARTASTTRIAAAQHHATSQPGDSVQPDWRSQLSERAKSAWDAQTEGRRSVGYADD